MAGAYSLGLTLCFTTMVYRGDGTPVCVGAKRKEVQRGRHGSICGCEAEGGTEGTARQYVWGEAEGGTEGTTQQCILFNRSHAVQRSFGGRQDGQHLINQGLAGA